MVFSHFLPNHNSKNQPQLPQIMKEVGNPIITITLIKSLSKEDATNWPYWPIGLLAKPKMMAVLLK
jgi:hypothetical protein